MSQPQGETRTVVLRRTFDAPIDLVYRAWTEAEHVVRWMKCDVAATLEVVNWVPAVGTEFRTNMVLPQGVETCTTGRFTEVDPPRLLAYVTYPDPKLGVPEMQVRVQLADVGGRTDVTLTQSGIPNAMIRDVMEQGWSAGMDQLGPVLPTVAAT